MLPIIEGTVPCKFCARQTRSMGTKVCDACWELETRLQREDPTVVRRILKSLNMRNRHEAGEFVERAHGRKAKKEAGERQLEKMKENADGNT